MTFAADTSYSLGSSTTSTPNTIKVNDPLRLPNANVYLLGHGYAPIVKFTDKYGHSETKIAPFTADGDLGDTSDGVIAFPDSNIDPATGTNTDPKTFAKQQIGFAGVYLPTAPTDGSSASIFPAERQPGAVPHAVRRRPRPRQRHAAVGLHARPDPDRLRRAEGAQPATDPTAQPIRLKLGETAKLSDGSTVQFVGTRQWVSLSIRYDPGEKVVLVGALLLVVGLLGSLTGRRRRVWFRVAADRTRVPRPRPVASPARSTRVSRPSSMRSCKARRPKRGLLVATLSHNLLFVAIVSYLFAMMCYAAEYAFGAQGAIARVAQAQSSKVLVGAGAPIADDRLPRSAPGRPSAVDPGPSRPIRADRRPGRGDPDRGRSRRARRLPGHPRLRRAPGAVGQHVRVHHRGHARRVDRWLGLVTRRPSVRPLGLFVTFVLVVLLGLDDTVLYTKISPLSPALNSYWLKIHVTLAITASGILMIGFCAAVLHLVRAGYEKRVAEERPVGFPYTLGPAPARRRQPGAADVPDPRVRLPDLDARDHLRRDLGRVGVGPLLGLGPEGDVGVHRLGRVRLLPARPGHAEREAHHGERAGGHRLGRDDGEPVPGEHLRLRPALLRRGQVVVWIVRTRGGFEWIVPTRGDAGHHRSARSNSAATDRHDRIHGRHPAAIESCLGSRQ